MKYLKQSFQFKMATSLRLAVILLVTFLCGGNVTRGFYQGPTVCPQVTFDKTAASPIAVGYRPIAVAMGDYNRDGKLDLAAAGGIENTVRVLLGNGAGGFSIFSETPAETSTIDPQSIAAGDFNADGNLDLAIANGYTIGRITILLGDGSGNFAPAVGSPVSAGSVPDTVMVEDFNLDGKLDLVTANLRSNDVTVLLGNGMGGFSSPISSPAGNAPRSLAVADFNRDGKIDLAVTNEDSQNVTILLGNGAGGFTQASGSPIALDDIPNVVAVADFNRDGNPDFAITSRDSTFSNSKLRIMLGNGSGGFIPATGSPLATAGYLSFVATGDFNMDSIPDLAVANYSVGEVTILLGDGTGSFIQAAGSPINGFTDFPAAVAVGEFNRDNKPDLAVLAAEDFTEGANLTILLNTSTCPAASARFTEASGSPVGVAGHPLKSATGDFNRDGKPDLAVVGNAGANAVTILLGNGTGGFSQAPGSPVPVSLTPVSIAVGDFNRDGIQDLVTANSDSDNVAILLGNGTGRFNPAPGSPIAVGDLPWSVAVRDFNLDGKQDVAVTIARTNSVTILLGNGAGGFSTASSVSVGSSPQSVAIGDFNRDGKSDLAVGNAGSSNLSILLGNGTGGFSAAPGSPIGVGNGPQAIKVGDFNRDGKPDLAVANFVSTVTILLGDGTGRFTEAPGSPVNVGDTLVDITVGDFNADGKLDLAVPKVGSANVSILLGDGTGRFSELPGAAIARGVVHYAISAEDFDRDGAPDIVVGNFEEMNVSILLNTRAALTTDLSLTKTASPNPVTTGANLTYTVRVANSGSLAATGVEVRDDLPASTIFVSCSATNGGICQGTGNQRRVTFNSLSPGVTATITLITRVNCQVANGSEINNTATVSSTTPDSNPNNNSAAVAVTALNPPPVITGLNVDKAVLWPANHKMVDVTVNYTVTDNCAPPPVCTLSVTSNEPVNGTGDGDTAPDWEIVDAHHVRLRAERSGNGNGRIYTVTVTCTDSGGRSSSQTTLVSVPKNKG